MEANFGTDSAKPFEYDIHKCPGLVFEWNYDWWTEKNWQYG
jgi:hypothetical protein